MTIEEAIRLRRKQRETYTAAAGFEISDTAANILADAYLALVSDAGTAKVLQEIVAERKSQVAKGFDAAHDDTHTDGSLARCAAAVILAYEPGDVEGWTAERAAYIVEKYAKRNALRVATSMLVAEIERMDRAKIVS